MHFDANHPDIANDQVTVLYDGGCPLCAREIQHYKNLRGADAVCWVDITQTPELEQQFGISFEAAMTRFHVRDSKGQWQTGAFGFVVLWQSLSAFRWAAQLLQVFRLVGFADWVYGIFARRRLQSRCADGACDI